MAEQLTNYQCPACTAPLNFSPDTGKLDCEFCDSSFTVAEIEALYADKNQRAAQAWDDSELHRQWQPDENLLTCNCPACGAELICEETTVASCCPYCGNPTVIPGQFKDDLQPDYVIPFKLTKEKAIAALAKHYKKCPLLPKTFRTSNTLEKIQGVYVPFWLYDGKVSGSFRFDAVRVHTHRQGDWVITEKEHFDVARSGSIAFEKVPVDASSKMPDDYMDSIEPFDYTELKPFASSYLSGFLADKYDVSVADSNSRADQRCINTLEQSMQDTVLGFQQCHVRSRNVQLERGKVHYALLPVWMLNVKWKDQSYLLAINGQTGRTVGSLPASFGQALLLFAKIALPLSVLGVLIVQVLG